MTRWWGQNIKIDGSCVTEVDKVQTRWAAWEAEQWEQDVQNVFRKIEKSKIGKKLLTLIHEQKGRFIHVFPIRRENKSLTRAQPYDWTHALKRNHEAAKNPAEAWSSPIPGTIGMPVHSSLMIAGTGLGTDVHLYYHPGAWNASQQMRAVDEVCGFNTSRYGYGADDVLFHELVHAWRAMKGLFEVVATGDTWRATEEFFAVVLSNIYVSETRPGAPLRGDNLMEFSNLKEAGRPESDTGFGNSYISLINQMENEMGGKDSLIELLKSTRPGERVGSWNPFRALIEQDQKREAAAMALP